MDEAAQGKRVLLVEDEFFVAMAMEEILRSLGFDVIGPAADVDDAVALASDQRIDLAILDVDVGGREVFPVADVLRARGVPYVLATGHDDNALPPRYRGEPRLRKPFDAHTLAAAMAQALALAGNGA
jgi:DNA-binding response OmpR family regulator